MKKIALLILLLALSCPALAQDSLYSSDDSTCYYGQQKILFCEPGNLDILGGDYARDRVRVYYRGEKIEGADRATFAWLSDGYARDRRQAYLDGQALPGADPATFEPLGGGYARDRGNLYQGSRPLAGYDPASFAVISADYTKDKDRVYYRHEPIKDSHPLTFRLMAEDYAKDLNYYYRYGQAVARSSNTFYERYRLKDLSDTCTVELLSLAEAGEAAPVGAELSKDRYCVYFRGEAVENSHAASFELIGEKLAKDKNFVYRIGETGVSTLAYADARSFAGLGGGYYKDNDVVYYGDGLDIINGADPATFAIVCTGENCTYEAEDKHRLYQKGLETALDEATRELIGESKLIAQSPAGLEELLAHNTVARGLGVEQEAVARYLEPLFLGVYSYAAEDKQAILNFIVYGTRTTRVLGAGERAGVVNSYRSAFGKLPVSEQDWADVIKIANGRWPTERNEIAEDRAEGRFRYIYRRTPLSFDRHDQSAITIIAYGLRTRSRNFESEKSAILTFRKLFMDYPSSAGDWDMVRAIAYSGATR